MSALVAGFLRIAVIILEFPALNETFILDHITGLLRRGHDVRIFATAPKGEPKLHEEIQRYHLLERTVYRDSAKFTMPGNRFVRLLKAIPLIAEGLLANPRGTLNSLNVFRLGKAAVSLSALYEAAPFLIQSGRYDIVHSHFPENGELAVVLRDRGVLTGKIVTQFHSYHLPRSQDGTLRRLYPNLFERADLLLTSGEHSKHFFDERGYGGERMKIHRYSVDLQLFGPKAGPKNGDQIRLLSVGRLVEKKGFEFGIMGVAKILRNFPNVRYEIAGDGPLKSNLERLIAELGVGNNIKLLGWQDRDEVLGLLRQTDIFLAPCVTSDGRTHGWAGDVETGPVVVLEAMASGIPVISTRHTGIPEFLHDGASGFLLEERDAEGIADRLTYLLQHPESWGEMGKKGRKRVEEYHNLERQIDRLIEHYQSLIQEDSLGPQALQNRTQSA